MSKYIEMWGKIKAATPEDRRVALKMFSPATGKDVPFFGERYFDVDLLEALREAVGFDDKVLKVVYDKSCTHWAKNADYNRYFLQAQQNYFNERLNALGHVFLNEVYDALGFKRTTQGAITGWLKTGNGFIDFDIPFNVEFDQPMPLRFNIDGIIYDRIED